MACNTTTKMVTLKSQDEVEFIVSETVAMQSRPFRHTIEDNCAANIIPVPNVRGEILGLVIKYWEKHVEAARDWTTETFDEDSRIQPDEELMKWDREFFDVDQDILFELLLAAHYLDTSNLYDAACEVVASQMKGKSIEEFRQNFNIKNDYTQEEEENYRRMYQWAFD